jgi:malate dehydrogenase
VTQFLSQEQQERVVSSTMVGGATLTKLIGTSAWYAPGAGTLAMVEAIVRDEKRLISCGVALEGEYGQSDISLVVPVILGKSGWEKIVNFQLSDEEQGTFKKSADAVRAMNQVLADSNLI